MPTCKARALDPALSLPPAECLPTIVAARQAQSRLLKLFRVIATITYAIVSILLSLVLRSSDRVGPQGAAAASNASDPCLAVDKKTNTTFDSEGLSGNWIQVPFSGFFASCASSATLCCAKVRSLPRLFFTAGPPPQGNGGDNDESLLRAEAARAKQDELLKARLAKGPLKEKNTL